MDLIRLPLETVDGHPLVHKYYRHDEKPEGLLVTLPGNHYGVDGPLLYYPGKVLGNAGWDTLAITYGFQSRGIEFSYEIIPNVVQECQAAIGRVVAEGEYERIALMGKSLGAFVILQVCTSEKALGFSRMVYLTPPLGMPLFDQMLQQSRQPALLALGTKDRFYNVEALEELRKVRTFNLTLIEGVDHSMDVAGDLDASLEAVRMVTRDVVKFITDDHQALSPR
jgi:dienelactone hydrolase